MIITLANQKLYRNSILLTVLIVVITILVGYVLNIVWYWLNQRGFNVHIGYFISSLFSLFGTLFLFGSLFAALHRRNRPLTRHHYISLGASMALYFLLMAGFEILWLQPWTMHTYIDPSGGPSHTYNAYTLDAMYNTMYVLPMVLAMLMSYLVTSGIMALWAKLPRPKRIVSEKPS